MKTPTIEQFGIEAVRAREAGQLDDAKQSLEKAIALCRATNADDKLVRALMLLGQIERDRANSTAALGHYQEAASISRSVDSPLRFAHVVRHLADLGCELGWLESSGAHYAEAIDIYRSERDASPGDLANAVRGLAVLKDKSGEREPARVLWQEALTLYRDLGVEEGVQECTSRLEG